MHSSSPSAFAVTDLRTAPRPAYLRLSITDRCNLRCVYCLPEHATFSSARASTSELMHLVAALARVIPIAKMRITGGEPTLSNDLITHVTQARDIVGAKGQVGLTSNGTLLEPLLPALRRAGLDRINISLDALDADGFKQRSRRSGLERVIASIRAAKRGGWDPVRVNVVAMADTDYPALVRFAAWEGVHVRFIELMAIGEARSLGRHFVSAVEMRRRITQAGLELIERSDLDDPTARTWSISGFPAAECSVGFITTMSAPFCATCNRLRLDSRGRLYTCLMDNRGTDLLTFLRAGDADGVAHALSVAVAAKAPPRTMVRDEVMAMIGG